VTRLTREATRAELAWVAPAAVRAQVVADVGELGALSDSEPWRVRVTERGEAVVLGRWREHLNDCAVLGLWCAPARVPIVVTDLLEVARERGFTRLLGPLVHERDAAPYLDAGLDVAERVIVMRADTRATAHRFEAPGGPALRAAVADDLPDLLRLDGECFEPFWHYDAPSLDRLMRRERVLLAVLDGRTVGYTLCTLRAGEGSLGRLAVSPGFRRRGIGRHLVTEALTWLASRGVSRVVLSTQEGNAVSRELYRHTGFSETGDVLIACASKALPGPSGEKAVDRCGGA